MAAGLIPAVNDARMKFALPSGISSISLAFLVRDTADWTCGDVTVAVAVAILSMGAPCLRRLLSTVTALSNLLSWASSRYLSDPARSPGSVTPAAGGASVDDTDLALEDGFSTAEGARFCRSCPPIAQECRTTPIGAILRSFETKFVL
jgi:hypothetical protein